MKTGDTFEMGFRMELPQITSKQHLFERVTALWGGKNPGLPDYVHIERHGTRSVEGAANRPHS